MKKTLFKLLMVLCVFLSLFLLAGVKPAKAATVKLNKKKVTIELDGHVKLKVKNTKDKVTWKSSDPTVARVSKKGNVYVLSAGECIVTAKVGKKTLTCNVTVTDPVAEILDSSDTILKTAFPVSSNWKVMSDENSGDTHSYIIGNDPFKTVTFLVISSTEEECNDINTSEEYFKKIFDIASNSILKQFKAKDAKYEITSEDTGFIGKMTFAYNQYGRDGVFSYYLKANNKSILIITVFEEGNPASLIEKTMRRILLQAECA